MSGITALFLIFLILKLTHVITWSWWLVTAPLWGAAILAVIGGVLMLIGGAATINEAQKRVRR